MHALPMQSLRSQQQQFDRRAAHINDVDFLLREAESRLCERLACVRLDPAHVLDAGCGTGRSTLAVARRFPQAEVLAVDLSSGMLAQARRAWRHPDEPWWSRLFSGQKKPVWLQADMAALPLAASSLDAVISNLALAHCSDPGAVFGEWARVLQVGGLLMASTLGPDTLREVRIACAQAGHPTAVMEFADMHDLGDLLLASGFVDPVVDMERITLSYRDVDTLLRELRAAAVNARIDRAPHLSGKRYLRALRDALAAQAGPDGLIRLTVELLYVHGWRGSPRHPVEPTAEGGHIAHVPIPRIRQ